MSDDAAFLENRIKALLSTVTCIDSVLQRHGYYHTEAASDCPMSEKKKKSMDKVAYASQLKRLHEALISANMALTDRVRECQEKGLSVEEAKDAFWTHVLLPGNCKTATVTLKDYGRAVDDAFFGLMNFLTEVEPVDCLEFVRKRNTLLNDKLVSLMEARKCQLQLLGLRDSDGPFTLSQWTMFAFKELTDTNPVTGMASASINSRGDPDNSDLVGDASNDTPRMCFEPLSCAVALSVLEQTLSTGRSDFRRVCPRAKVWLRRAPKHVLIEASVGELSDPVMDLVNSVTHNAIATVAVVVGLIIMCKVIKANATSVRVESKAMRQWFLTTILSVYTITSVAAISDITFCMPTAKREVSYLEQVVESYERQGVWRMDGVTLMVVDLDNSTNGRYLQIHSRTLAKCDDNLDAKEVEGIPSCIVRQRSLDIGAVLTQCARVTSGWVVLVEDDCVACDGALDEVVTALGSLDQGVIGMGRFSKFLRATAFPVKMVSKYTESVLGRLDSMPHDITIIEQWAPGKRQYVHQWNLFHHIGHVSTEASRNDEEYRQKYTTLRSDVCYEYMGKQR